MLTPQNLTRHQVTPNLARKRLYIEHLVDFVLNHLIELFLLTLRLLLKSCITLLVLQVDDLRW